MALVQRHALVQYAVEELVVVGLDRLRVAQERPRRAVGGAERSEQVLAAGQQALEQVEPPLQPLAPAPDVAVLPRAALERVGDQVRLALPRAVEPVEEQLDLGPRRRRGGEQR